MANYSFLVGGDLDFFPAANALLNSLDYIGFTGDVNFIAFRDFPLEYLKLAQEKFCYNIVLHPFNEEIFKTFEGQKSHYMKRYRYGVASEICKDYGSICFIDIDMFFVRNVDIFFEIASHDIMLGCAKTGKVKYGGNPSYFVDGKDIVDSPIWNDKDMCCCPIFFNSSFSKVFSDVYHAYTTENRFQASDLFAINSMVLHNGVRDRLLTMPCQSWVGTNETMLKPFTRVVEKDGNLISENGEVVYSVHGKWFSEGWHNGQIQHMDRAIERYLGNSKQCIGWYKQSMQHIMNWQLKMQFQHKIKLDQFPQYTKEHHMKFMKSFME